MPTVVTLESKLSVLRALDEQRTVLDLVPLSGLSRPTIYVVMADLLKEGFVTFETVRTYRKKKNGKNTGWINTKRYIITGKGRKRLAEAEDD